MSSVVLAACLSPGPMIRRARASRHMDRGEEAYAGRRFTSALRRWRVACTAGSSEAAFRIAELYVKGEGVQRNLAEAVKWYRQAAERGHAKAQYPPRPRPPERSAGRGSREMVQRGGGARRGTSAEERAGSVSFGLRSFRGPRRGAAMAG